MKDLKPTRAQRRLLDLIEQGEHEQQDFKYLISDARKIARSISAFANNAGGRLLIGVKDNGTIAGVKSEEDIYMIEQAGEMYCDPPVQVDFEAVKAVGGAVVFIAGIKEATSRPVMVKEADGSRVAYYRVNDENHVAPELMVEAWRMADSDHDGMLLTLSDIESDLLKLIAERNNSSFDELVTAAHVSRHAGRCAVVRLLALRLIEFRHDGHRFALYSRSDI